MIYGNLDGLSDKFGNPGNKLSLRLYKSYKQEEILSYSKSSNYVIMNQEKNFQKKNQIVFNFKKFF
jgi:hypothetical protein